MAHVLVLQHGPIGAVRLGATLRDHGFKLDIRRVAHPTSPDPVPGDLDDVHAIVTLGGPQSAATDSFGWMDREMELLRAAHEAELPVVGICLGHQLIAKALGGSVERMETPEWGFGKVSLPVPAQTESLLAGIPWDSMQFQTHHDHVTELPPGAVCLGSSQACPVQIFKAGHRTLGFQFHLEVDVEAIRRFASMEPELMAAAGVSEADIEAQVQQHYARFAQIADRLCVNMATFLFPFDALTQA
ncbi:MAG: type 1 glutamine amidotransferase [Planctomycetota bacterium]